ncbi:hypothetical protein LSH36_1136g01025 [Paralvinella palmiformis]|uniref:JNK1/MAPK8-associated membrane protein n=1 Tax=Paralvinella palmiformis TaxID=53620 RepID=A0AAD9MQ24_9ANNE|nr:hypothetical protein LSH36_1136g01025 [Paralvinella palmiformis]
MRRFLFFILSVSFAIAKDASVSIKPARCPGLYCGWNVDENGNRTTACGACPRGARPNEDKICQMCTGTLTLYDWLYLGFMAILSPILNWFFIDVTNRKKHRLLVILHLSAFFESLAAAVCTVLVSKPVGSFRLTSCPVVQLSDWYTMLKNPTVDYTTTLHCTQEAVYPLYTIVMIYYAFCLGWMLLIRIALSVHVVNNKGRRSIYAALYFLPILIIVQAVFAGLIYYSFPYILLVTSVMSNAIHLAYFENQDIKYLLKENFRTARNLVILIFHWILHSYGIIAVTLLSDPGFHGFFLCLVPFPAFFYLITVKFTDPRKLLSV